MVLSIEELKALASNLMKEGLNTQQIADELSLSQDTITWLLSGTGDGERPSDVRIGWRTLGVRPQRIAAVGSIMADVADEELGFENIDTVVGISINGAATATMGMPVDVTITATSSISIYVTATASIVIANVGHFIATGSSAKLPRVCSCQCFLCTHVLMFMKGEDRGECDCALPSKASYVAANIIRQPACNALQQIITIAYTASGS